jgi:hypothetical protein
MQMFLAIFNCGAIYSIVWLFERKRIDMNNFSPADIMIVPCVVLLAPALLGIFVHLPTWVSFVTLVLFVSTSFWMFWKKLPTSSVRAGSYSALLLTVNIVLELVITGGRTA